MARTEQQKGTATAAFRADADAANNNGRESKMKVEAESDNESVGKAVDESVDESPNGYDSEGSIDVLTEKAMVMVWGEVDVPCKDSGISEERGEEEVMSIIGSLFFLHDSQYTTGELL